MISSGSGGIGVGGGFSGGTGGMESTHQAPANVRVLVRVRPSNDLDQRGGSLASSTGVLTIDNGGGSGRKRGARSAPLDFGHGDVSGDGQNGGNATVTVNDLSSLSGYGGSGSGHGGGGYDSDTRRGYDSDGRIGGGGSGNGSGGRTFVFDAVHGPRSTQSDVFESVKGIVDCVASGYNGTIVAYGQTGSGKTHTVFGSGVSGDGSDESAGLVQRSLKALFRNIAMSQAQDAASSGVGSTDGNAEGGGDGMGVSENSIADQSFEASSGDCIIRKTTARASFFEIFNERVYDLLSGESLETVLPVREDSVRGVYVDGLQEVEVNDTAEAEAILARGNANRQVASTSMNRTSSRSHAVFVLTVRSVFTNGEGLSKVRTSKFTLVDLAGSERQKSTHTAGDRLKEASSINTSLLTLGNVINALVDREQSSRRTHVPFRDSKLTFLLRDSWGGNSKTCLVATVSPAVSSVSETVSTLKFAQRAKLIKNTAVLNEDTCGTVAALQAEVTRLRSQLEHNTREAGPSSSSARVSSVSSSACSNGSGGGSTDVGMVDVIERRARRAEGRASTLQTQLSRRDEVVRSLKRKLQEENMVRKFKQRRIEFLSKKADGVVCGNDGGAVDMDIGEEIAALRGEIDALRRQVDAPCPEAVELKTKYDQVRDELEDERTKARNGSSPDDGALDEMERQSLEDTIAKLTDEKRALEDKVAKITGDSSETQKEIDEILQEVGRLEAEMVSQKDQLNVREEEVWVANERVSTAEAEKEELASDLATAKSALTQATDEVERLRESTEDLQRTIAVLTASVDKKKAAIADIEAANAKDQDELQSKIDELSRRLEESHTSADDKAAAELEVREQLAAASKDNSILVQRVQKLQQEKDEAIDQAKGKLKQVESELETKVKALEEEKDGLSAEISRLETATEEARKQAEATAAAEIGSLKDAITHVERRCETIRGEKEADIEEMRNEAHEKEAALEAKVQALQVEKQSLELVLETLKAEAEAAKSELREALAAEVAAHETQIAELEGTIQSVRCEKDLAVAVAQKNVEEVEALLGTTVKSLEEEKADLQEQVKALTESVEEANAKGASSEEERKRQEEALIEMQATVNGLELRIQSLQEEKEQAVADSQKKIEEAKASFSDSITTLEAERDDLASQIESIKAEAKEARAKAEADIEKQRSVHEQAVKDTEERIANLVAEKDEAVKETYNDLDETKTTLEAQIASLEEEKTSLSQQLASLQATADEARKDAEAKSAVAESELDAMRSAAKEMEERIHSLQEEKNDSVAEVRSELQAVVERKDFEIEGLRAKEAMATSSIESLQKERGGLSTKITSLQAEIDESKAIADEATLDATKNLDELKARVSELEEGLAEKEKELERVRSEMQSSFAEKDSVLGAMQEKHVAMEAEYNQQASLLKEMEEKVAIIEQEKETMSKDMGSKLVALEAERQTLKEQANLWERAADDSKKRAQSLNDKIKLVARSKNSLEFELDTLREDQDTLNEQVRCLHERNDELEQENARLSKLLQVGDKSCEQDSSQLLSSPDAAVNDSSPATIDKPASPQPVATPFRDLSSQMDCVLNRMTDANPGADASVDDSFDEDMFLPNAESPACNKELSFLGPDANANNNDAVDKENATPFRAQASSKTTPFSARRSAKKKLALSGQKKGKTPHKTPSQVKKYPKVMSETKHRTGWSSNLKMN